MKRAQIVYGWLIAYVDHIVDSVKGETFAEALDFERANNLANATDVLRGRRDELKRMRVRRSHYPDWRELWKEMNEFHQMFPDFPELSPNRATMVLSLARRVAELGLSLDADPQNEIDTKLFDFRTLSKSLPVAWFAYANRSFKDSTVVMASGQPEAFVRELSLDLTNERLFFYALAALTKKEELVSGSYALVKRISKLENEQVEAFVSLVLLANGRCVHIPHIYPGKPKVDVDSIVLDIPYQQMNEAMYVLSEYNSRDDLLTKFLTVYHVIENFMYKLPIVELETRRGGKMFSIRNFRTLYESVSEKEETALKGFLRKALEVVIRPSSEFSAHLKSEWARFVATRNTAEIATTLLKLDIDKKANEVVTMFTGAQSAAHLASITYRLRNAIVHNKETELHLTYSALEAEITALLGDFLLPVLEELCFSLISKKNTLVWYANRSLSLY